MPISEKIQDEILKLDVSDEFKGLMMRMLKIEDRGRHQNNKEFEKELNKYLEENGSEIRWV